jgi:hypothetical protein
MISIPNDAVRMRPDARAGASIAGSLSLLKLILLNPAFCTFRAKAFAHQGSPVPLQGIGIP